MRLLFLLLSGLIPVPSMAQAPVSVRLAPANGQLQAEFAAVGTVRELADRRVLVSDPRDLGLVVVDFAAGTVTPVGRKGSGPGEYRIAGPLLALGRDSTLMADVLARRWLILDGARIAATTPPDDPAVAATLGLPRGADVRGYVIGQRSALPRAGDSEIGKADSAAVIRVARATGKTDTIGFLRRRASRTSTQLGPDGGVTAIRIEAKILTVGEEVLLFPDGWLAVVRIEPYRVEWRTAEGRWIGGAPVTRPAIRLSQREKEAHMERLAEASGRPLRSPDTITDWPGELPPFLPNGLLASPDGRLLVRLQPSADHPETRYDLFDRNGRLEAQLVLAANERIAGFGAAAAYVVVSDEDGIQRLARHPWTVAR